ncbi:Carboxypeptidase Y inhibitor [Cytospora mali]|uniref:Carboxypeptidase Y inhibitor n=1 Tax=Cytospora mali TaxID=578113 RepID=A0A194VHL0_CYTMA|nr:Carboxypeptidase Y inhibitor [Valsa mali]
MPSNKSVQAGLELLKKDPSKVLGLTIGKHNITEPGQYVPRADARSPPQLTLASASPSKSYVVIALDLDAPFPSFDKLGPILHWVQSGLKVGGTSAAPFDISEPFVANYIGPAPPPGSSPHRYVFFLYEQPEAFDGVKKFAPKDGKNLGNASRMWASLDEWEKKLGLGEVVAVNYFNSN